MTESSACERVDLKSKTLPQLEQYVKETLGQPKFRAGQIYQWMHQKQVQRFDEMTNLSAALRAALEEQCTMGGLEVRRHLTSKLDDTQKFLFGLADGESVETVLMHYHHGNSLCISTQVGCRMGCRFCASTLLGLSRNLAPSEMLDQIYTAQRESGQRIGSLVLMGIGEPLDNFDSVMDFLTILSSPEGQNLSLRHVSLSTCGLVPEIVRLMEQKLQITLSISLHAPTDELRSQMMPINHRYPLAELMEACRAYFRETGRRISYEYALIRGVNDSEDCARQLAALLQGQIAHVNLIPVNEVQEREYRRGTRAQIEAFQKALSRYGVNSTVRRELGADIRAACGQLRREEKGGREDVADIR